MKTSRQTGMGLRRSRSLARKIRLLPLVLLLCSAPLAMAHGTAGERVERRAVCAQFSYDDGEAMSYAKVTVKAPDSEVPFQSGATDRNGIACFAPDRAGTWRLSAGDGMGHLHNLSIAVADETGTGEAAKPSAESPPKEPRSGRILAGIGLILAMTGLVALYQAARREKKLRALAAATGPVPDRST